MILSLYLLPVLALAQGTPNLPQVKPTVPPPRVQDPQVPTPVVVPTDPANKDVPPGPLTAKEAAQIALKMQPSIVNARGAVETARGRTTQSAAALNPQVVANAGYDSVRSLSGQGVTPTQAPTGSTTAGVSPVYAYSTALYVRQLLWDFNQTRNVVRQNRALADAALANLSRTQQDVVNNVEQAFYNYANARRLVEVNTQNLANRQRQLDLANARLRNDIGLPMDVVTAETSKSQAVLALIVSRDAEQQARVTLLNLMGVNPLTPIEISDTDEPAVAATDPKQLIADGLKNRPEVRLAQSNVNASRFGLSAAKAVNLPSLYGTLGAGTVGNDFDNSRGALTIGIGVNFPLIDGGQRRGAIQSANGQLTTAQADLQTAVLRVQNDVTSAYLSLLSAEQRVTIANNEVANAREGVRIAEGRYSAGLGLFQDITTAQSLLLTALQDQVNAEATLNLARVRVKYATGQFS